MALGPTKNGLVDVTFSLLAKLGAFVVFACEWWSGARLSLCFQCGFEESKHRHGNAFITAKGERGDREKYICKWIYMYRKSKKETRSIQWQTHTDRLARMTLIEEGGKRKKEGGGERARDIKAKDWEGERDEKRISFIKKN